MNKALRICAFLLLASAGNLLFGQSAPGDAAQVVVPPKEKFQIYLLMGQSNMVGRDTKGLENQKENPRILSLNAEGQWVVAKDPLHEKNGRIDVGRSPGIPFAEEMLKGDPGVTIGLVPCAVGGTPLRRWVKGADLYEKAVARAKAAAGAGEIKGVLWHQGESDTNKMDTAQSYETRLTRMIGDLRADLGKPGLPVVVGQLGEFLLLTPEKYPGANYVMAAIRKVSATVPGVGYADSAGLGHKGDKLHFTAEAENELGERYAEAMKKLSK